MMLWLMSRCHNKDILNNAIFAFKMSSLSERHLMTVVINMHKLYFIFKTRCHVSLDYVLPSVITANIL